MDTLPKNPAMKSFVNQNKSRAPKFVEYINLWKLQTALNQAEEAITRTRSLLRKSLIGNRPSNDYKAYLERVKNNIDFVLGKETDAIPPPPKVQKQE